MPKPKTESLAIAATNQRNEPTKGGSQRSPSEADGKSRGREESAEGATGHTSARPTRGRTGKRAKEPDYSEYLDLDANPQLRDMSPAWQQFYAAIRKAARDE